MPTRIAGWAAIVARRKGIVQPPHVLSFSHLAVGIEKETNIFGPNSVERTKAFVFKMRYFGPSVWDGSAPDFIGLMIMQVRYDITPFSDFVEKMEKILVADPYPILLIDAIDTQYRLLNSQR